MRNYLVLLLFILALHLPHVGAASIQDSVSETRKEIKYDQTQDLRTPIFNEKTIQNFKEDSAFDYTGKQQEKNWWQRFKSWLWKLWLNFWNWLVGDYQAEGIVAFLVRTLPYLIIIGIVIFVGWLFYKLDPGASLFRSSRKPELLFSEEEEIIKNKDISELIEKALVDGNYRLAIRYYYLLVLQKLTEAEIINYESDKTNSEYISEITSEELKAGFRKATNLYDYVWYGNFAVTETDFSKAQPVFSSLKKLISKNIA
ncbi:DUF4129 domain-containing protein [Aequorivita sp. H23M31]|uniref:DUF4129 domain-containing protein n=1 Tax=Aequorivita ciconiae TaxID=2494375 RepID=A0A451FS79_9FLAO|nr:DUF4129 domain-containing protein [Aequorivita sp. H23M31]QAA80233.1 DUF4129 domain-containing protein [Aequorivita sp. H23M31]